MVKKKNSDDSLIYSIIEAIEDIKGKEINILDLRELENTKGNTILMATHDFILIKEYPHTTLLCNNKSISSIDITGMGIENIYE